MKLKRRDFLKGAAGVGALMATGTAATAAAREKKERLAGQLGILYDSTLCIGCQVCMVACKKANGMPVENTLPERLWDDPMDLSAKTLNVIKRYQNGTGRNKDQEEDGFAFIKRHCMHCVDPGCVSACPVSALTKDPGNGVVTYNKDACIGCRYCQVACPFNVPKFEWDSPFPKIVKCQLCSHLLAKGEISACCGSCPTGASLFGPADQLLLEARRRLTLTPGTYDRFPVSSILTGKSMVHRVPSYIPALYGENEVGGTQVIILAGVPFDKLGLPTLPEKSFASTAEGIQHTLYRGMILPALALGGLMYFVSRHEKKQQGRKGGTS